VASSSRAGSPPESRAAWRGGLDPRGSRRPSGSRRGLHGRRSRRSSTEVVSLLVQNRGRCGVVGLSRSPSAAFAVSRRALEDSSPVPSLSRVDLATRPSCPSPLLRRRVLVSCGPFQPFCVRLAPRRTPSWAPLLGLSKDRPSAVSHPVSTPGPSEEGPSAKWLPRHPARSALVVSHDFDGLLHRAPCRSVAPCYRPWGSPRFRPVRAPILADVAQAFPATHTPFGAFPSTRAVPPSPLLRTGTPPRLHVHRGLCPPAVLQRLPLLRVPVSPRSPGSPLAPVSTSGPCSLVEVPGSLTPLPGWGSWLLPWASVAPPAGPRAGPAVLPSSRTGPRTCRVLRRRPLPREETRTPRGCPHCWGEPVVVPSQTPLPASAATEVATSDRAERTQR